MCTARSFETMRQYVPVWRRGHSNASTIPLSQGITGLSIAFDLPTQMGFGSDADFAREIKVINGCGHQFSRRHADRFERYSPEYVSTSMTINATALYSCACMSAVAVR
ncbi:MAG: hypothetical protein H6617_03705 [Bdellovibrionaceae bacterium]|nr:hypothetical protein [Pseudobdellovibrionaceae bacterium]